MQWILLIFRLQHPIGFDVIRFVLEVAFTFENQNCDLSHRKVTISSSLLYLASNRVFLAPSEWESVYRAYGALLGI